MDIFGNFYNLSGDNAKRVVNKKEESDFSYSDVTMEPIGKVEEKNTAFSVLGVKAFLTIIFCILVSRLFILQIVEGQSNQSLAEGNRIRPRITEASRGIITDKNGVWLARNKADFALVLYPSDLPKKKVDREEVYNKISKITSIPVQDLQKQAEENGLLSLDEVLLQENVPHDDALILEKKIAGIPGIEVAQKSAREYATTPGLSHLLGYTGKISRDDLKKKPDSFLSDRIGKTGLEAEYEDYLKGKHGIEQIEKDSKGNVVRVLVQEGNQEPVPGSNVSLYLDRGLQEATAKALDTGIGEAKKLTGDDTINAGVVAVMDVNTGGILAMVSTPYYDNNLFATKISNADYQKLINDKSNPMLNRAIAGIYPPGSISKIILASAGLSEKAIAPDTSIETPEAIKIGDYSFPDWKYHTGTTNVERAIAESNNIFFYALGGGFDKIKGIGIDNLNKYWKLFGLGEETGIDLPGESSGFLPTPEWKKKNSGEPWYIGDTYHASIGQGDLLTTPIQMLRATAAIANGGKLLKPQLVKKISDSTGKVINEFGPRIERDNIVSQSVIKTVQEGMRRTVTDGSARNMQGLPVNVAGKTGTAQFLNNQKTHAWFECYAPYEKPEIAIISMIEGGGGGHEIAAPIAREILNYYYTR